MGDARRCRHGLAARRRSSEGVRRPRPGGRSSPRASSGSTRPTGSTRSSWPRLPTGRSRRSSSPRSSSPRRSRRSSPAARRAPSPYGIALAEVPDDALVVLVHDAARPLVDDAVIERLLGKLAEGVDGVVPGLPLGDTVKRVEGGLVAETLDRDALVVVQTPQAFVARPAAVGVCRRSLRGDGLRVARRAGGRTDRGGRGRSAPRQGDDRRRPRARRPAAGRRRSVTRPRGRSSTSARRSSTRSGTGARSRARRVSGRTSSGRRSARRSSEARSTGSSGGISGSSDPRTHGARSCTRADDLYPDALECLERVRAAGHVRRDRGEPERRARGVGAVGRAAGRRRHGLGQPRRAQARRGVLRAARRHRRRRRRRGRIRRRPRRQRRPAGARRPGSSPSICAAGPGGRLQATPEGAIAIESLARAPGRVSSVVMTRHAELCRSRSSASTPTRSAKASRSSSAV